MQISLTQDANAGKLRSFSLTGGSLCLQGWSCYAQTLHLQSKLIDSYTLHLLCLWWCQRICDIPVIIAQCHRSQPHLMWGSLLLCLSLQGIGPSLLQCPQCQEICYSAKEPTSFYTVLIKGFYFCSSCFWPWAEICAMSWVFLTSSHIGKRIQWFFLCINTY